MKPARETLVLSLALGLLASTNGCQGTIVAPPPAESGGFAGTVEEQGGSGVGGTDITHAAQGGTDHSGAGSLSTGGTAGTVAAACSPTLDSLQRGVFVGSCSQLRCHGADAPAAALDLTVSDLELRLVGVRAATCETATLVVPGSPEQSFLFQKLTETMPDCGGERMPIDEVLPPDQIECVASWIRALAPSGCETCGGDTCLSLLSDPNHCGECGNACPSGTTCAAGTCACPNGLRACGDACTDLALDSENCGECARTCGPGSSCVAGACTCESSLASCDGACVDLESDAFHCGRCGEACDGDEVCLSGSCSTGCGELTQCGTSCVDLETSALHCGGCDTACSSPLTCERGDCRCSEGRTLCSSTCVDTATDPTNCGACGTSCGPGAACSGGNCLCGDRIVSFRDDVLPVLTGNCTASGCHTGNRPKEELALDAAVAYDELVGVRTSQCGGERTLVVPGNVAESYLMNKLVGVDMCSGSLMPKAGQDLEAAELALINAWICQGAQEN